MFLIVFTTNIPLSVSFVPLPPIVSSTEHYTLKPSKVTSQRTFFTPVYLFPSSGDGEDKDDNGNKITMKNMNGQEKLTMQERIDGFLDTPFFDPDRILDQEEKQMVVKDSEDNSSNASQSNNPLVWFAQLVRNDYETAEALYAAGFISILVILTQELLRMVIYGDAYIPFTKIGNGSLF